jgi:hypothetical protein
LELEEPDMVPMFEFDFHCPEKITGTKRIQGETFGTFAAISFSMLETGHKYRKYPVKLRK